MSNYLFEIGTENLPVDFQISAEEQLKDSLENKLQEAKLSFDEIKTFSTPRRLSLVIQNLTDQQPDETQVVKGPPASVAFKDGSVTQAGTGFAKKVSLPVESLTTEEIDGVSYVVAKVFKKGKNSSEILQDILPKLILNLKGSHFMRWQNLDEKFSRPIRYITSILDNKVLPITIANTVASNSSFGHMFLCDNEIPISSIDKYEETLYNSFVIVDPKKRSEKILNQLKNIAESKGGVLIPNDDLLKIVTNLVEWPICIAGEFEKKYLSLPPELIKTVMASHQKYFPIYNTDKKTLTNYFIFICDKNEGNFDNIIKGNQRVLKARLEDALFYYQEDNKKTLFDRLEDLKGVTFQKGLGTMYDKTKRIKSIAQVLSSKLNLSSDESNLVSRSAELCKTDLITFMVREFTDLEGIIGKNYAINNGENPIVAEGIGEQYLPRSADDKIPESITGKVVAISDKIDTITSVFSIGKIPSGSADPLGLRRAAMGIILITLKSGFIINISDLINSSIALLEIKKDTNISDLTDKIKDFIAQRLRIYLIDQGIRYDIVDSVMSNKDPLQNIQDVCQRANIVNNLVQKSNYSEFHESANRLIRISKGYEASTIPDKSLFIEESENIFYEALSQITFSDDYNVLVAELEALTPKITKFFDDVMVLDKDEKIKNNRLALVLKAVDTYKTLADFSKIVN